MPKITSDTKSLIKKQNVRQSYNVVGYFVLHRQLLQHIKKLDCIKQQKQDLHNVEVEMIVFAIGWYHSTQSNTQKMTWELAMKKLTFRHPANPTNMQALNLLLFRVRIRSQIPRTDLGQRRFSLFPSLLMVKAVILKCLRSIFFHK